MELQAFAALGRSHTSTALGSDGLSPHVATTQFEGRPASRSPEQLHLHPALEEMGLPGAIAELNQAAQFGAQSVAAEPVLITSNGMVLAGFGRWHCRC